MLVVSVLVAWPADVAAQIGGGSGATRYGAGYAVHVLKDGAPFTEAGFNTPLISWFGDWECDRPVTLASIAVTGTRPVAIALDDPMRLNRECRLSVAEWVSGLPAGSNYSLAMHGLWGELGLLVDPYADGEVWYELTPRFAIASSTPVPAPGPPPAQPPRPATDVKVLN